MYSVVSSVQSTVRFYLCVWQYFSVPASTHFDCIIYALVKILLSEDDVMYYIKIFLRGITEDITIHINVFLNYD